MNPPTEKAPDEIRSDIDTTRRRIDETMDELGDRLQPKHLLDEVVGYFRGEGADGEPRFNKVRDSIIHSATSVVHSVVDGVKKNPVPVLLIGAGIAWMIYASRRERSGAMARPPRSAQRYLDDDRYASDSPYDRPLDYPASGSGSESERRQSSASAGNSWEDDGGKVASGVRTTKDRMSEIGDAASEKLQGIKRSAHEVASKVKESTVHAYTVTRDRIVTTADQHPLEVGLAALAAGVVAGLALPTPNIVNRQLGGTADRLRDRTREVGKEMLEKGKHVAEAAVTAVKDEAAAQGLTTEILGQKVGAVAERAKQAGHESAKREGLTANAPDRPAQPRV